jgi:hypothetical protein
MATTTPNYGWTVPTSSDLVKNGATAIETLGDSVDDALWSSGYGQAGKNKIINGDFAINQRNFTSTSTNLAYGFDRFNLRTAGTGGTTTWTPQAFTVGTAPVAGYESTNYSRVVTSGFSGTDTIVGIRQPIEDVRTFAGQTVTVSFWAKAATGTPNIGAQFAQVFGAGGSTGVATSVGLTAITTSWARYSFTINLPSISGKTLVSGNYLQLAIYCAVGTGISGYGVDIPAVTTQNNTFDIWGIQVEAGSKATPFQTASGGSPQAELAMCQRYYYRSNALTSVADFAQGLVTSVTNINAVLQIPVPLRTAVATIDYPAMSNFVISDGTTIANPTSITLAQSSTNAVSLSVVYLAFTVGRAARLYANGTTNAYIGMSAEL